MDLQQVVMVNSHCVFRLKFVICTAVVLFLIVVLTEGHSEENCNDAKWLMRNEDPCLSHGGICVKDEYCPKDFRAEGEKLCPEQESNGAVCCNKVPEEASCHWHGGDCMGDCGGAKNFGQKNCPEGKTCCFFDI